MHRASTIAILAALTACGSADDLEPDDVDTSVELDACEAEPVDVRGSEGHVPMDPGSDIIVRFDRSIPEYDWGLTVHGATGRTELGADHTSVVFRPDAPLAPETAYDVQATICGHPHRLQVATGRSSSGPAEGTEPWSLNLIRARWERADVAYRWLEVGLEHLAFTVHRDAPLAEVGTLVPHGMTWARCGTLEPLVLDAEVDVYRAEGGPVVLEVHDGLIVFDRLAIERPSETRGVRLSGRIDTRRTANAEGLCDELPRGCLACEDGSLACAPFEGRLEAPQRLDLDPGTLTDACE